MQGGPGEMSEYLVEKRVFEYPGTFTTAGGAAISRVRVGYECHGALNAARDNAILIAHYNSGTSHFAGKYTPDDEAPGYWDAITGPGKPLDSTKYFLISVDTLCNVNAADSYTITTGPASIDPKTGKPYGMRFPLVQIRDFVTVQRALLESLGITRLHAVVGASMGSMQAFEWAAIHPDWVPRAIGVVPCAFVDDFTALRLRGLRQTVMLDPKWNRGDYYGSAGPVDGLALALRELTALSLAPGWGEQMFRRTWADSAKDPAAAMDHDFASYRFVDAAVAARIGAVDANSFMYIQRANELFTLAGKSTLAEGLASIAARVLLLPSAGDQVLFPDYARAIRDLLRAQGNEVRYEELQGPMGHLNGVYAIAQAGPAIAEFLSEPAPSA
jgi:homoserine O-acetyltransferase/O-succinyltransferase